MSRALTPSTVREPLLKALRGLPAGTKVQGAQIIRSMLEDLKITDPAERDRGHTNARWLATQVLRKEGLLADGGRGNWIITPEGEKIIQALLSDAPGVSPIPADPITVDPIPGNPSPWANDDVGECPFPVIPVDTYSSDPYLRSLAIKDTPCFGNYAATEKVCKTCPIAGSCVSHQILQIARIAEEMRQHSKIQTITQALLSSTVQTKNQKDDLSAILEELYTEIPKTAPAEQGLPYEVTVESKCYLCKNRIAKGSPARNVPHKGLRHEYCV